MHKEAYSLMTCFVEKHLAKNSALDILDIGSFDVNGTFKPLFQNTNWTYTGLDLVPGPNVDIVSKSEYDFALKKKYDVIISGNTIEHIKAPWKFIQEVSKNIKHQGLICFITPLSIGEHRYPVDCWRILPDGYKYLLEEISDFKILEVKINNPETEYYYKFFTSRPGFQWIIKFIPDYILDKLLKVEKPIVQDVIVIAKKIN